MKGGDRLTRLKFSVSRLEPDQLSRDDEFVRDFTAALRAARVPENRVFDERPASSSDFPRDWRQNCGGLLNIVGDVLDAHADQRRTEFVERFGPRILVLVAEQLADGQPWVVTEAESRCGRILSALERVFAVDRTSDLFSCKLNGSTVLVECLEELKLNFKDALWKAHPAAPYAFTWILTNAKFPNISTAMPLLFPPIVRLLDDFVRDNYVLGMHCVSHVVDNVTPSEMRWGGRADVVLSKLPKRVDDDDVEAYELRHFCLLRLFSCVIRSEQGTRISAQTLDRIDDAFEDLLLRAEGTLPGTILRTSTNRLIPKYLNLYELDGVKWTSRVCSLLADDLTSSVGDAENRLVAVQAFTQTIRILWPVMSKKLDVILVCLRLCRVLLFDGEQGSGPPSSPLALELKNCASVCRHLNPLLYRETLIEIGVVGDDDSWLFGL